MDVVRLTLSPVFNSIRLDTLARHTRPTKPFAQVLSETSAGHVRSAAPYTVRQGDTLWWICRNRLSEGGIAPTNAQVYEAVQRVAQANGLQNPDYLQVGQRIELSAVSTRYATRSVPGASKSHALPPDSILGRGGASQTVLDTRSWMPSKAQGKSTGPTSDRSARLSQSTTRFTLEDVAAFIETILNEAAQTASPPPDLQSSLRRLLGEGPVRLSSGFGTRTDPFTGLPEHHNGIDIAAPTGTPIYPMKAGRVTFSGWSGGYGRTITVQHEDGAVTRYGHTSRNLVREGEWVTPDKPIAHVGTTGRSTGPHLHFEYHMDGRPVDPIPYLSPPALQVASRS